MIERKDLTGYDIKRIANFTASNLVLDGGVPEWTMTVEETEALVAFAQEGAN